MRRSGSTLQFQLTARIAEEEGIGKRIEWVKPEHFPIVQEKYKDYQGLKIFKTHIHTPEIGDEFKKQNARGVYIFRDIRDAFLSQQSKDKASFSQMWVQNFLDSAIKNYNEWTALPGMYIAKYEDVMTDLPGEVQKIAAHLGVNYDGVKSRKIAEEYTLERQKERIDHSSDENLQHHQKAAFDRKELLHLNHIYSGKSERWKREMNPWQIALIENRSRNWLNQNGYQLSNPRLSSTEHIQMWLMNMSAQLIKFMYYRNKTR